MKKKLCEKKTFVYNGNSIWKLNEEKLFIDSCQNQKQVWRWKKNVTSIKDHFLELNQDDQIAHSIPVKYKTSFQTQFQHLHHQVLGQVPLRSKSHSARHHDRHQRLTVL